MPWERYHILQNEIDPRAGKVDSLEGAPLRRERAAQGRLLTSRLGKARPGAAIKAIQTMPGAGETTGPRPGATVPGRPLTSSGRRRKGDTAPDGARRGAPQTLSTSVVPQTRAQANCPLRPVGSETLMRPHLWDEDRDSPCGSVSVLRGPGGGGLFPGLCTGRAGPAAGFGAQSQGHSSAGPFPVETSGFWPTSSWFPRRNGDAQLVEVEVL